MKKIILTILGICILAFLWWTISPVFINKIVDDEMPTELSSEILQNDVHKISDTPSHPATGDIRITQTDKDTTVRYENYDGTNGPDLFVYLAKDLEADEFVSLGRAKGNMGNINYEVPEDLDISEYSYVLTWCKTFGVLFDYAEIN